MDHLEKSRKFIKKKIKSERTFCCQFCHSRPRSVTGSLFSSSIGQDGDSPTVALLKERRWRSQRCHPRRWWAIDGRERWRHGSVLETMATAGDGLAIVADAPAVTATVFSLFFFFFFLRRSWIGRLVGDRPSGRGPPVASLALACDDRRRGLVVIGSDYLLRVSPSLGVFHSLAARLLGFFWQTLHILIALLGRLWPIFSLDQD